MIWGIRMAVAFLLEVAMLVALLHRGSASATGSC
jgi:hypothetical protein